MSGHPVCKHCGGILRRVSLDSDDYVHMGGRRDCPSPHDTTAELKEGTGP